MSRGTCFIVSPIGDEDKSPEIRQHFDVIRRVLMKVCTNREIDLDPVSAVDITHNGDINEEIIQHLREDVFCVVNLDGLNANVMYELGIRVQTGKPFVSIAPKDLKLPFDRISKRTLFFGDIYSVLTEHEKFEDELKNHIISTLENHQQAEQNPLPTTADLMQAMSSLRESLRETLRETLSETLREKPVLSHPLHNGIPVGLLTDEYEWVMEQLKSDEAILYALQNRKVQLLDTILSNYPDYLSNENVVHNGTSIGSAQCANIMETWIDAFFDTNEINKVITSLGALVTGYNRRDCEIEKIEFVDTIVARLLKLPLGNKDKAKVYCSQERLYYGFGKLNEAIELSMRVVEYDDEKPSYFYNLAMLLNNRNEGTDFADALCNIKKMLRLDEAQNESDIDHLKLAYRLLIKSEKAEDKTTAIGVLKSIADISPLQAQLVKKRD
ncbi:hypothetical protein FACS1894120_2620 [Clostridia bacterium]|nr:hypothetical protein FACS1894120_2620 [Clostridia bacterium]